MTDLECSCPPVPIEWHLAISNGPPRDDDCPVHGMCSYCCDTGWVWVNAVECTHCEAGRVLGQRGGPVVTGGVDWTIVPFEVVDEEERVYHFEPDEHLNVWTDRP